MANGRDCVRRDLAVLLEFVMNGPGQMDEAMRLERGAWTIYGFVDFLRQNLGDRAHRRLGGTTDDGDHVATDISLPCTA